MTLAGKLARLGEAAPWIYHLMSHIYASIAFALRYNETFLMNENGAFRSLIGKIKALRLMPKVKQDLEHMNFYVKKAARRKFKSSLRFDMNATLREEIEILRSWLNPDSGINWESPMGHLFHRTPFAKSVGDSSCEGGGGFSIKLKFWWHLLWPQKVYRRTKVFVENNSKGKLISINVLEFVSVVVNYCVSLTALLLDTPTDDPHPVLLNEADNTSSIRWCNHSCKSSLAGRALGRFFCMLLVDSPLGINSKWISTEENEIADAISRLKAVHKLTNDIANYTPDYSLLKQRYPNWHPAGSFSQVKSFSLAFIDVCSNTNRQLWERSRR